VKINIDSDYVDVRPLPGPRFNDFTGNGWTDLLGRDQATGDVYLYPGNGANLGGRTRLGIGWTQFSEITRSGDFNSDGIDDVIARDSATGYLCSIPAPERPSARGSDSAPDGTRCARSPRSATWTATVAAICRPGIPTPARCISTAGQHVARCSEP
jgi:hypothetical protein